MASSRASEGDTVVLDVGSRWQPRQPFRNAPNLALLKALVASPVEAVVATSGLSESTRVLLGLSAGEDHDLVSPRLVLGLQQDMWQTPGEALKTRPPPSCDLNSGCLLALAGMSRGGDTGLANRWHEGFVGFVDRDGLSLCNLRTRHDMVALDLARRELIVEAESSFGDIEVVRLPVEQFIFASEQAMGAFKVAYARLAAPSSRGGAVDALDVRNAEGAFAR